MGVKNIKIELEIQELGLAQPSGELDEIIIALSPSFGVQQRETIVGLSHAIVVRELAAGVEEEGFKPRFVKYYNSSDLSSFSNEAAKMSGSGISIGIQSKGTIVIHQRDLQQLDNLEIFPQAPLYDANIYRQIGKNAARYGKGNTPEPVPTLNDQMALAKYQIKAALLHIKETELVVSKKLPVDIEIILREVLE
ncbi:MAG: propanediol/glycerol family dehydratase medium subunit [Peptostreptococcaceae bacterium]|nr:propanediol/glycerol family dehydratase medium subunit [Peptostreptococcaceae bacterium]